MGDIRQQVIYQDEIKVIVYYPLTGAVMIRTKGRGENNKDTSFYCLITEDGIDGSKFTHQSGYQFEQYQTTRG